MYTYPNGMTCNVSPRRAKAFEMIVPPHAVLSILAGFIGSGYLFFDATDPLKSFVIIATSGLIWTFASVAATIATFIVWCRPIDWAVTPQD